MNMPSLPPSLHFDDEQLRIIKWRASTGGIAAVVGPPGCGKTTVGSALAVKLIAEGLASRVLMVAYTNAAANEFCWELYKILGPKVIREYCLRTGNLSGVDEPALPVPFSIHSSEIKSKKIIICTTLSLKRLSYLIKFDNIIIDEAGIEKLEHLLSPFYYGINQLSSIRYDEERASQINNLMDLINQCGIVSTVVGDPKQSRPIGISSKDASAIEWVIKGAPSDTLRITHRLPDKISGLVNEFASYGGLRSATDIASRRLILHQIPDIEYKKIINPDERAQTIKDQLLATVSHEFRTGLAAIGGYADLLEIGIRGPLSEAQLGDVRSIRSAYVHLAALIDDLLDYSRIAATGTAPTFRLDISDVVLSDAIRNVAGMVGPQALARSIMLSVEDCPAIVARADVERLGQILLNLLGNAVKFTPSGGRIQILSRATETDALVEVADTGLGVPDDKREEIFQPFVRLGDSIAPGTGLGLAISRDLARAMGGDIVMGASGDCGSRFVLRLPRSTRIACEVRQG
jgi:signal transduction histidine kinase